MKVCKTPPRKGVKGTFDDANFEKDEFDEGEEIGNEKVKNRGYSLLGTTFQESWELGNPISLSQDDNGLKGESYVQTLFRNVEHVVSDPMPDKVSRQHSSAGAADFQAGCFFTQLESNLLRRISGSKTSEGLFQGKM